MAHFFPSSMLFHDPQIFKKKSYEELYKWNEILKPDNKGKNKCACICAN